VADLRRPVLCPGLDVGNLNWSAAVAGERLVRIGRRVTELIAQRLKAELVVECGTAKRDELGAAEMSRRAVHIEQIARQPAVVQRTHRRGREVDLLRRPFDESVRLDRETARHR